MYLHSWKHRESQHHASSCHFAGEPWCCAEQSSIWGLVPWPPVSAQERLALECGAARAGMLGCMGGIYKCPVSGEGPIGAHVYLFPAVICPALSLLCLKNVCLDHACGEIRASRTTRFWPSCRSCPESVCDCWEGLDTASRKARGSVEGGSVSSQPGRVKVANAIAQLP